MTNITTETFQLTMGLQTDAKSSQV